MEIPSDLPSCCSKTSAKENAPRCEDNGKTFDIAQHDFSEFMDFDEAAGGELMTSGMVRVHAEKTIDSSDRDFCQFSSDTPVSDFCLYPSNSSGGAQTNSVYSPFSNISDNISGQGLHECPFLATSRELPVFDTSNHGPSSSYVPAKEQQQNLPHSETQNLAPQNNFEGYELVCPVSPSPLGALKSRTIITLEEAEPNTVMEMMSIAVRSKAKVRFENY